ncbi:MAG: nucleotide exchange factor GrpE [Myxococcota bacterium]
MQTLRVRAFSLNRDAGHASLPGVPQDEPTGETAPKVGGADDESLARKSPTSADRTDDELQAAMNAAADAVDREQGDAAADAIIKARKELEGVLDQTKKEVESFREKWLRSAADLENYRKRAQREREEAIKFGNEKLLRDFLPLVDDLERAVEVGTKADNESPTLLDGMKLVHKKFLDQLGKHGVNTFEVVGETFDPTKHEAVQQSHGDQPAGAVMTQLQRGFMLNDRLLRPALVVVSLGPASDAEGEG